MEEKLAYKAGREREPKARAKSTEHKEKENSVVDRAQSTW